MNDLNDVFTPVECLTLSVAINLFDSDMAATVAKKTRSWYQTMLKPMVAFFGDSTSVSVVSRNDVKRWRAWLIDRDTKYGNQRPELAEGLSAQTIRGYLRATKRFFNWCIEEGYLIQSPADKLKMPPVPKLEPKTISGDSRNKMLAQALLSSPRDYAIVCLLVDTGARANGILSLTLDRVDVEGNRATVIEKGDKSRPVYFHNKTAAAIQSYLDVRPKVRYNEIFLNVRKIPLTQSGLYQMLKRLAKKAVLDGRFNPHSFRHAFARDMLRSGANLSQVSALLGHSDPHITIKYYARYDDTELAESHRKHSPMNFIN